MPATYEFTSFRSTLDAQHNSPRATPSYKATPWVPAGADGSKHAHNRGLTKQDEIAKAVEAAKATAAEERAATEERLAATSGASAVLDPAKPGRAPVASCLAFLMRVAHRCPLECSTCFHSRL